MTVFIGNNTAKEIIDNFLKNDKKQTLLLLSPNGSGKTTFCNQALEEYKDRYNIFTPHLDSIENHKQFVEQINNFIMMPSMFSIKEKKCLFFFDDLEILLAHDRFATSFIISLCDKYKIIVTCSTGEEKKVTELKKKKPILLHLEIPTIDEIINVYGEQYRTHALNANCNIGQMLQNNIINKYFDQNIYQIVAKVFKENDGIRGLNPVLAQYAGLVSFIMYDNYLNVFAQHNTNRSLNSSFIKIAKTFLDTSIIEDTVFYDILLNDMINIIRCQTIRLEQDKLEPINCIKIPEIKYTQINSRSAQHFNISQKMCSFNFCFNDIAKEAEYNYKLNPKKKMSSKTDKGVILNAYMFNFCSQSA